MPGVVHRGRETFCPGSVCTMFPRRTSAESGQDKQFPKVSREKILTRNSGGRKNLWRGASRACLFQAGSTCQQNDSCHTPATVVLPVIIFSS